MKESLAARLAASAFEKRYTETPDPWQFATSPYEQDRYQTLLRALAKPGYDTVYEPGCSIGVLTQALARRARTVIAADVSATAVRAAQARCQELPNVRLLCASVDTFQPPSGLDLVVFSEIGYYFDVPTLAQIANRLAERLRNEGEFVAVHWLGESQDHELHGDVVHDALLAHLRLQWIKGARYPGFRVDSWRRS